MVSQIELLLNYSNRFYNRQFITRKAVNHDIITALDRLLNNYFDEENSLKNGLPSVKYISSELKLSQRYLSDMLSSLTGFNTQQYIQNAVIEKLKKNCPRQIFLFRKLPMGWVSNILNRSASFLR